MIKLCLTDIFSNTADTKTLYFKQVEGDPLVYQAGQFLTFIFNNKTGSYRRSYSLSSSPDIGEPISITVKHTENGEASTLLTQNANPGDLFTVLPPAGLFKIIPEPHVKRTVFMFAAGSGIAPVFAMIKSLLYKEPLSKMILAYSNRNEVSTIFLKELKQLQFLFPEQLVIWWLFSTSKDLMRARLNGNLIDMVLNKEVLTGPKLAFVCGPYDYMENTVISLLTYGFKANEIRKEQFVITLTEADQFEFKNTQTFEISIKQGNKITQRFSVPPSTTILRAALNAGIDLPYSCMAGKCSACSVTCNSGEVKMSYNEVLTEEELNNGRILTCTGYPQTDMVLSY